jgi:hypothetical protein
MSTGLQLVTTTLTGSADSRTAERALVSGTTIKDSYGIGKYAHIHIHTYTQSLSLSLSFSLSRSLTTYHIHRPLGMIAKCISCVKSRQGLGKLYQHCIQVSDSR